MNDERIDLPYKFSTPKKIYQTLKQRQEHHTAYKDTAFLSGVHSITERGGQYASEEAYRNII